VRHTGQHEHRGQADRDRLDPGVHIVDAEPTHDPGGNASGQQGDQRSHVELSNLVNDKFCIEA